MEKSLGCPGLEAGLNNSPFTGSLALLWGTACRPCGAEELEINPNAALIILPGLSCCPAVCYWARCSWRSFTLVLLKVPLILFFFCKVIILCIHSVIPWMCSKCLLSIPSRVGRAAGRKEALGRYMVATEEDCVYPYCSRANSLWFGGLKYIKLTWILNTRGRYVRIMDAPHSSDKTTSLFYCWE